MADDRPDPTARPPDPAAPRDLRLDFFRGLALWFIFVDHVPSIGLANLTFRNFGFSDATEIFVFISGYTAALVYGRSYDRGGAVYMGAQVLRRCWQLYVAHVVLVVFYIAQVAWISDRFAASPFVDEMNIARFFDDPRASVLEALMLQYRPVNLDVLPLYVALLASLPAWLVLVRRSPAACLAVSIAIWAGVQRYGWAAPVYANGDVWMFNPLGWQLLFVIGVVCAATRDGALSAWTRWRGWLAALAAAWLGVAAVVAVSWKVPALEGVVTPWVEGWLYPIDKTDLDAARILHFLAVAWLAAHAIPPGAPVLRSRWARPVVRCGQHSLQVFCLGISLSFAAYAAVTLLGRSMLVELGVVGAGLAAMIALASAMHWYGRRGAARPAPTGAA